MEAIQTDAVAAGREKPITEADIKAELALKYNLDWNAPERKVRAAADKTKSAVIDFVAKEFIAAGGKIKLETVKSKVMEKFNLTEEQVDVYMTA
jgi:hypothetical protein